MEEKLKYIATDSKSFRELIEGGYLYIDKTEYLYKMLRKGSPSKYWFLSRPRRFGKSLLIDTLENIFKGNRELFKGTYIYDNYDFEEHPVIRLNMSLTPFSNEREMLSNLYDLQICDIARRYGIDDEISRESSPAVWLHVLITGLYRKYGKAVVVLVDEYDNCLLNAVKDEKLFEKLRDLLAGFYEVLKTDGDYLRFCFLTGVTRFQHVSIFSKLNNLTDISTDPEYAAICGYTDDELDHYFAPYIKKYFSDNNIADDEEKKAFRARMKEFYDGYRFSLRNDVTMYNPVSVGKFFIGGCSFGHFWIETGAQSLVDEIVSRNPELFHEDVTFSIYNQALTSFNMAEAFSPNPDHQIRIRRLCTHTSFRPAISR